MWVTYGRNVPMPLPLCQGLSKVSRPVSRESKPVSKTVMTGSSSTTPTVGTGTGWASQLQICKIPLLRTRKVMVMQSCNLHHFQAHLSSDFWAFFRSKLVEGQPQTPKAPNWIPSGQVMSSRPQVDRNSCAKMMSEAHLFSKSNADKKTCATLSLAYLLFLCDVFGEGTSSFTRYMPCITS